MNNIFIKSATTVEQCPQDNKSEICLVGRSNVGKSSLINALANQKIARVSNTPGRTQMLNFYIIDNCRIVDLPGYGYAKISITQRDFLSNLIGTYLRNRENLKAVFQVVDARVITTQDYEVSKLINSLNLKYYVVVNKYDKLNQSEKNKLSLKIADYLKLNIDNIILVSALKKYQLPFLKKQMENCLK